MEFDDSSWPVLKLKLADELPCDFGTSGKVVEMLNEMTIYLSRAQQFVLVIESIPLSVFNYPFTENDYNPALAWLKLTESLTKQLCIGIFVTNIETGVESFYTLNGLSRIINQIPCMPPTTFFDSKQAMYKQIDQLTWVNGK